MASTPMSDEQLKKSTILSIHAVTVNAPANLLGIAGISNLKDMMSGLGTFIGCFMAGNPICDYTNLELVGIARNAPHKKQTTTIEGLNHCHTYLSA